MASNSDAYLRIQFTLEHPDDVAKYGDKPYLYDEQAIASKPGRQLAELEELVGMPMPTMMNGVRQSKAMADLAAMWLCIRMRVPEICPFEEFNVRTIMVDWAAPDPELLGKASALPTSDLSDSVSLPSLPKAV